MILNIGLSNVNSLIRKLTLVMEFLNANNLHILCITETHLLQSVQSSFVDIPSYSIARNDVLSTHAKHGACLYIHKSSKFEKIDISCPNVISISLPELNVHIIGAYRPPSQSSTENQVMLDYLSRYCIGKEVYYTGGLTLTLMGSDCATWACFSNRQTFLGDIICAWIYPVGPGDLSSVCQYT